MLLQRAGERLQDGSKHRSGAHPGSVQHGPDGASPVGGWRLGRHLWARRHRRACARRHGIEARTLLDPGVGFEPCATTHSAAEAAQTGGAGGDGRALPEEAQAGHHGGGSRARAPVQLPGRLRVRYEHGLLRLQRTIQGTADDIPLGTRPVRDREVNSGHLEGDLPRQGHQRAGGQALYQDWRHPGREGADRGGRLRRRGGCTRCFSRCHARHKKQGSLLCWHQFKGDHQATWMRYCVMPFGVHDAVRAHTPCS